MLRHVKTAVAIRHYQPHKAGKGIMRPEFRGVAISSATSELISLNAISLKVMSSKVIPSSGVWSLLLLLVAAGGRPVAAGGEPTTTSDSKETQQASSEDTPANLEIDNDDLVLIRHCSDLAEDGAISAQNLAKLCGFDATGNLAENPKDPDGDESTDRIIWKSMPLYEDGQSDDDVPAHEKVCKISDQTLLVWVFINADGKIIRFADAMDQ